MKRTHARQQRYRSRLQEKGYKQVAVWLDEEAATALRLLQTTEQADAKTIISAALKHYYAARLKQAGRAQSRWQAAAPQETAS